MLTDLATPLGKPLIAIEAHDTDFSLEDAVTSYLFNSQIVTLPDGSMSLVAPLETTENPRVAKFIESMLADDSNPINTAHYLDVRESMRNGGGPACLRLRVPLSSTELAAVHQGVILNDELHAKLVEFVTRTYPDEITQSDLLDPSLASSCIQTLDELTQILDLPGLYPFQQ